jgi:hypothetical protein
MWDLDRYDRWFNFQSWRDFTLDLEDPFDLEEASCREERRWMDRPRFSKVPHIVAVHS